MRNVTLPEYKLRGLLHDAWQRGYDLGTQHGTETKQLDWIQHASRDSHQRMLVDLIPDPSANGTQPTPEPNA